MSSKIQHLDLEEAIEVLHFLSNYAFTPTPPLPQFQSYAEKIRNRKGANYFAVYENNQPQAIACATTPLTQNLRGKLFSMGGVSNVATHPDARRKGYARNLMHTLYNEFNQNNVAVSCLYPFKEDFYQSLGYITLPQTKRITFNPLHLKPLLNMDLNGHYELVTFKDGYQKFRSYLEKHQQNSHGMAISTVPQPEAAEDHDAWLVFAYQGEEILGVMNYILKDQILNQTLLAYDFLFSNSEGKFLLLNWIARHLDQVSKAILTIKPDQFGENLFTDLRPDFDGLYIPPMARVIKILALSGLPVGDGDFSIQVNDPECPWNNGIWQLTCDRGQLGIIEADHAQCELTVQGLTALVYGVYPPGEFALRNWGNPDKESQSALQKMFPPMTPFLHAVF